jgi:hypothetical protein
MRPTGLESIRAIQAALAEVITPELSSTFAQDAAQTLQMLLESLASEWDTAAERLSRDNEILERLLQASCDAIVCASSGNERLGSVVSQIEKSLDDGAGGGTSLTALSTRNRALQAVLDQVLMAFEDTYGEPEFTSLEAARRMIYAHLREHATRGWSFWDVSSFRGRIAAIRTAAGGDDAPSTRGVE